MLFQQLGPVVFLASSAVLGFVFLVSFRLLKVEERMDEQLVGVKNP